MLELHAVAKGLTMDGKEINPGDVVYYRAHLPRGNVKIAFKDGTEDIAHPGCFEELR